MTILDPFARITAHPVTANPSKRDPVLKRTAGLLAEIDRVSRSDERRERVERVLASAAPMLGASLEEVAPREEWDINDDGVPVPLFQGPDGRFKRYTCDCPRYVPEDMMTTAWCSDCGRMDLHRCTCAPEDRDWTSDPDLSCIDADPPKVEPIHCHAPPYQGGMINPALCWIGDDDPPSHAYRDDGFLFIDPDRRPHAAIYTCGAPGCACEDAFVLTRSEWVRLRVEVAEAGNRRFARRRMEREEREREEIKALGEAMGEAMVGEAMEAMEAYRYRFSTWSAWSPSPPSPPTPRGPNRAERRGQGPRLRDTLRNRVFSHRPVF